MSSSWNTLSLEHICHGWTGADFFWRQSSPQPRASWARSGSRPCRAPRAERFGWRSLRTHGFLRSISPGRSCPRRRTVSSCTGSAQWSGTTWATAIERWMRFCEPASGRIGYSAGAPLGPPFPLWHKPPSGGLDSPPTLGNIKSWRGEQMSKVRVLVGTRKGAFVLTSDGKREKWDLAGPHFTGWEIYHVKGSSADPNRIYASQSSGWFGQIIQRSNDGGQTWQTPGGETIPAPGEMPKVSNKFAYDTSPMNGKPLTTHQWYDGTQHPWEFKRVWHLEPSLTDPDSVYAGVEDAAIFKTTDGAKSWNELPGLRGHGTGPKWQPGAGGMCLHTILLDPSNPGRIYIAISAAGAFRTDDGGATWKPINRGLHSLYIPDPTAEVGHCVHHIAMNKSRPGVL